MCQKVMRQVLKQEAIYLMMQDGYMIAPKFLLMHTELFMKAPQSNKEYFSLLDPI